MGVDYAVANIRQALFRVDSKIFLGDAARMNQPPIPEMTAAVLQSYGWTLETLSNRVGLSIGTLSRLARGEHASTSWEAGQQIAALYAARPPVDQPRTEKRGRPRLRIDAA